jgi:hypothetical protein
MVDGEELPISICLTQHRLSHQLGSSLLLQKDPVLDLIMLASSYSCYSAIFLTQGVQYSQVCKLPLALGDTRQATNSYCSLLYLL